MSWSTFDSRVAGGKLAFLPGKCLSKSNFFSQKLIPSIVKAEGFWDKIKIANKVIPGIGYRLDTNTWKLI